jgi:hypothetical protein
VKTANTPSCNQSNYRLMHKRIALTLLMMQSYNSAPLCQARATLEEHRREHFVHTLDLYFTCTLPARGFRMSSSFRGMIVLKNTFKYFLV